MSRKHLSIAVAWALLLLPASLFAQKDIIKGSAEPSGKAAIQAHESPSAPAQTEQHSNSEPKEERVREPRVREERNEESSSSSSYEAPAPVYVAPTPSYEAPKPQEEESRPRTESPKPRHTDTESGGVYSEPRPVSGASNSRPNDQPAVSPHATGNLNATQLASPDQGNGASVKYSDEPLPGVHPLPLPTPLGPRDARPTVNNQGTIVPDDDEPPLPPHVIHGVVLSAPARPNYQTLGYPSHAITGLVPVAAPRPKPTTQPTPRPAPTSTGASLASGSTSDPYNDDDSQTSSTRFSSTLGGGFMIAPELACIYLASDSLVSYFRNPKWCTPQFEREYSVALKEYLRCFRRLDKRLVDAWMWPCYLTFEEEFLFWSEECAGGEFRLQEVRDLMRRKAIMVPQLLIDVDVKNTGDWAYVDTAFAAPSGGRNYYAAMSRFAPDSLLPVLQTWVRQYPSILNWPSYVTLQDFYASYFRSDIWLMLRTKAMLSYADATGEADPVRARVLAENAAWLCLSLLLVDRKDDEVHQLKNNLREFLREDAKAWRISALRPLME